MATFTIEFREVLASPLDLGLDTVELFDESYRPRFKELIEQRYWWREICTTPAPRFAWMFNRKLNEIMPYYNELYRTTLIEINPLHTFSTRATGKSHAAGTSSSSSDATSNDTGNVDVSSTARTVGSNTPVTQLSGLEDYASSLTDNTAKSGTASTSASASKNASEGKTDTLSDYVNETSGYSGNPGEILLRYRESLTNIDTALLDELNVLFYPIYIDTIDLL